MSHCNIFPRVSQWRRKRIQKRDRVTLEVLEQHNVRMAPDLIEWVFVTAVAAPIEDIVTKVCTKLGLAKHCLFQLGLNYRANFRLRAMKMEKKKNEELIYAEFL